MIGRMVQLLALLATGTSSLGAQDTVTVVTPRTGATLDLTSRAAREAVSRFNDPNTTRYLGPARIETTETIPGDIGVYAGALDLSGVVRGDVTVINGDIRLGPTAVIQGDLMVLGGAVMYPEGDVRIDGSVTVYRSRVLVAEQHGHLQLLRGERPTRERRTQPRWRRANRGNASIAVSTGGTYNRVEGLPIHVGPRFQWGYGPDARVRVEALGILRTAGDFEADRRDLGYTAGISLRFGESPNVTISGRVYDVAAPVEDWQLSDEEVGLASFLWHRDYRDYYLKRGVSGTVGLHPTRALSLQLTVARNEETSVGARDPWTPFRGSDPWRPNPAIDEGHFTSIGARATYDTRPHESSYRSGWLLSAEWERGTSDDLLPRALPATIRDPIAGSDLTFDRVFVDLRRYERLGRQGQIALRAVAAGVVGDNPLPVQRRLSVGGPDPLPGFPFRRLTCAGSLVDPANPAMCDRLLLFQFEYRGSLSIGRGWDVWNDHAAGGLADGDWDRGWDDWAWIDGPEFVLFGNTGTAWLRGDDVGDFEADVGVGLEFGSVGLYGAKAVTEDHSLRLTLRLHRRF